MNLKSALEQSSRFFGPQGWRSMKASSCSTFRLTLAALLEGLIFLSPMATHPQECSECSTGYIISLECRGGVATGG
jgi:hypothetical protein